MLMADYQEVGTLWDLQEDLLIDLVKVKIEGEQIDGHVSKKMMQF